MLKKLFLLLFAIATVTIAEAQTADEIQNAYYDFNHSYVQHQYDQALSQAEKCCLIVIRYRPKRSLTSTTC